MALLAPALGAHAQTSTTTALVSSANPSTHGQTVTLTATVTGSSPTGTVTFKDGAATIGASALSAGVALLPTASLSVGSHTLTAVYSGDAGNLTSTSSVVSQTVTQAVSSTSLAASPNPSTAGQTVTFTATVTGSTPTGTVTFKNGSTVLGTSTVASGSSAFSTNKLIGGSHSITALYGGNANNSTSTSTTLTQVVSAGSSTTTLTVTPASATVGQNVTLQARVYGFNPVGTVTFTVGGSTTLGTATVAGGAATLSVNTLALGSHSLSAGYGGDISNSASTSSTVTATVATRAAMTWQYGYDAMGRPNTVVDPNGLASYTYYDSLGRPIQTQQPPNTGSGSPTVIQLEYNLADGLTSVADPRNLATTYSPNGLGNVASQSSPDTGTSTFAYDAKGNITSSTDARGKTTTFAYDALDRLTTISYPTGTTTTFEFDGGSGGTAAQKGELTKITDESGSTTFSHDALGRMTGKSVVIGTRTFTIGYSWGDSGSALDKLTAITYPSGSRVNYSYDSAGYLSAVSVSPVNANGVGVGSSTPLLSSVTYNVSGNYTGWAWSDGKARTIGYDSNGLVTSYTLGDPTGASTAAGILRTVARDAAGRITGYTHTNSGTPVTTMDHSFAYDNLDRLTSTTLNSSATNYTYDETGNRTSKTIGATTYTNTIASTSNRLNQSQDVGGTATITHDAAGHITSDGTNSFSYNDRGRMVTASNAGGTVTYVYNGLNHRVGKTGPSGLVPTGGAFFLYDEAGQMLGEYDADGAPVYETIYLGSTPVGVLKQTGTAANSDIAVTLYNSYADHIDTTRVITRQDHVIVWRWDTAEAFGGTAPDQNPNSLGGFVYNPRFPGQTFDAETGLFQNWNREYNARLGRYIQSDPIGLAGGINTFAYVDGDPLTGFDPLGVANGGAAQMWMKKPQPACTCPDIMAYQAGIGKDGAGGTEYGHHWLELGQSESYGYWPNGSVSLTQTLLGVPGSVNRGRPRDPHHGDHASAQVSFPAKSAIQPSSSNSCKDICEQAKQCIRNFAAGYNTNYGGKWSYRGEIGDNNCHTFQRRALDQCRLQQ